MKNKKIGIIALVIIIALILAIIIIAIISGNDRRIKKQLDLGQKYLSEMNYEEAIVSFTRVLEIDPMCTDAYLGLTDAYVGINDFGTAKATLENGIKLFIEAGKDSTVLENKLVEIEGLIIASGQLKNEEVTLGKSEKEDTYPTISIEPVISSLNNVWGRNWLDWTIEDFVAEFNLPQITDETWLEEYSESKYQNRASVNDGESSMWTAFHYGGEGATYEVSCKSLIYTSDRTMFSQEIEWYEYNEAIPENPVVHDDICAFAEKNGISSLVGVAEYFGLNIDEIGDSEAPMKVNTEYGIAEVSCINFENGDGYYAYIIVDHIENLEGFSFSFTECDAYFRFDATQYK